MRNRRSQVRILSGALDKRQGPSLALAFFCFPEERKAAQTTGLTRRARSERTPRPSERASAFFASVRSIVEPRRMAPSFRSFGTATEQVVQAQAEGEWIVDVVQQQHVERRVDPEASGEGEGQSARRPEVRLARALARC